MTQFYRGMSGFAGSPKSESSLTRRFSEKSGFSTTKPTSSETPFACLSGKRKIAPEKYFTRQVDRPPFLPVPHFRLDTPHLPAAILIQNIILLNSNGLRGPHPAMVRPALPPEL